MLVEEQRKILYFGISRDDIYTFQKKFSRIKHMIKLIQSAIESMLKYLIN